MSAESVRMAFTFKPRFRSRWLITWHHLMNGNGKWRWISLAMSRNHSESWRTAPDEFDGDVLFFPSCSIIIRQRCFLLFYSFFILSFAGDVFVLCFLVLLTFAGDILFFLFLFYYHLSTVFSSFLLVLSALICRRCFVLSFLFCYRSFYRRFVLKKIDFIFLCFLRFSACRPYILCRV